MGVGWEKKKKTKLSNTQQQRPQDKRCPRRQCDKMLTEKKSLKLVSLGAGRSLYTRNLHDREVLGIDF